MSLTIKKFSSTWCKNCLTLAKTLSLVLEDYKDIKVESIDVEEDDDAAVFYNIRSLPTLVFLKDDVEVYRCVGTKSKEELKNIIEEYASI